MRWRSLNKEYFCGKEGVEVGFGHMKFEMLLMGVGYE